MPSLGVRIPKYCVVDVGDSGITYDMDETIIFPRINSAPVQAYPIFPGPIALLSSREGFILKRKPYLLKEALSFKGGIIFERNLY